MNRKVTIVLGIALIAAGIFGYKKISNIEKDEKKPAEKALSTIFTETVKNQSESINITESGRLTAKNKADIYAEVQGVMQTTGKEFKAGVQFSKGQVLVKIKSSDSYANLQAQKSVLQNLVTSILPDLRLDYPESFERWNQYVINFDIDKPIPALPETASDKEKYFITGKNIYTTYYNTKNLEIVQSKYNIRAPYSGVVTEALVRPGTVIRTGQKLGEFIDPSVYELEIAISHSMISSLAPGQNVMVSSPGSDQAWVGKVARINGKVDATTQTVLVFIDVKGEGLKEGLYLEAHIEGQKVDQVYELDSKLLVGGNKIYTVVDNKLKLVSIQVIHKTQETVIVSGLTDGTEIVSKLVPGAYEGMEVKVYSEKKQ
ncbi:Multidrug efflux pump subunit AcrA (membrane-fusion protein) [Reichenbachiella agariperforans]|uniref:Multidrug efflux pump subunit AcrA (Membrane-fusion protein) n=1 Tax=Reichenbachiella agariperforans TaxID=156994 RepID=A0A1M6L4A7_REIAG|nr:HlyD family efflux transporter periplasmic adaptor subunit [Reichenbachiella agariperforans]SHJ65909.1 Multidrug efflux pump subunit AcrA (membrane-fusion protein) [Reichenbachiella agariperforans]